MRPTLLRYAGICKRECCGVGAGSVLCVGEWCFLCGGYMGDRKFLGAHAAMELWSEGKDAWNAWAKKHPDWDYISFEQQDFTSNCFLQFSDFEFPEKSNVSFDHARLGVKGITFYNTHFGDGGTSFENSKFNNTHHEITFNYAVFGAGGTSFRNTIFTAKTLSFKNTLFRSKEVLLENVNFLIDECFFDNSQFCGGNISFNYAQFASKKLSFNNTKLEKCTLSFKYIKAFSTAVKQGCKFDFSHARFKDSSLHFGTAGDDYSWITTLSFEGMFIDGVFSLQGNFSCIPDLRYSKTSHHVDLSELKCTLKYENRPRWKPKKAADKTDIARLRKLKEIAESNKHYEAALRFNADEHRAKRWHEYSTLQSWLDMGFDKVCNYGQSILQPFMFWFCLLMSGTELLWWKIFGNFYDAFTYMLALSLPFLPVSKTYFSDTGKLFANHPALELSSFAWCIISSLLIFLILLGVRNRFRL
jgi:hypothetical protein